MADYVAVDTLGWFDSETIELDSSAASISGIYLEYSDIPNEYITKCVNSSYAGSVGNYNNERELFDLMVTEAYNKHGVCMDYYITSFDKSYNKIWGEDNNRRFIRRFQIMAFFNLPREEKLWTKFGIEGMDSFSMYVSKRHFWETSQYDDIQTNPKAFDPYIPRAGDYIFSKYNKFIYEIVEVKDEIMMNLLSKQHVWEFMVKPFKDEKIAVTPATSAAPIADFTNKKTDKFDITQTINNKKDVVNYKPKPTECNSHDPFSNW
jgi:hypothetical protein